MRPIRFGELLGQVVELTPHDVEEILNEQSASRMRFGEIALAWGLCQPEHIWNAWMRQLDDQWTHVDIDAFGVDTQALSQMTAHDARRYQALPLRATDRHTVIAISASDPQHTIASLPPALRETAHFVVADAAQLAQAIQQYYGETPSVC